MQREIEENMTDRIHVLPRENPAPEARGLVKGF